jgi:hypothetical protein
LRFLTLVDLPDELYARAIDEREYITAEVVFIDLVDLGGDFQRDASGAPYSSSRFPASKLKQFFAGLRTVQQAVTTTNKVPRRYHTQLRPNRTVTNNLVYDQSNRRRRQTTALTQR